MNSKFLLILFLIGFVPFIFTNSYADWKDGPIESGNFGSDGPFERNFGDVKLLDAYFGTLDNKIEVGTGDSNVPFTIEFANVGTQDITGIEGKLALPLGFSGSNGPGTAINANTNTNSLAGKNFHLTFYVNLDKNTQIQQYSGTVKVDYSRLRESGVRTSFSTFDFKVTGDSTINVRASESFLTSLKSNNIVIDIVNDGTAPMSAVDVIINNAQTSLSSNTASITNIENVLILESSWDLGNIPAESHSSLIVNVYVPESLKGDTLRINGLGGKMVNKLLESKNYEHFQEMSLEFAKYVDVMTPRMQKVVNELSKNNIKCGIALFGETIFSMIPKENESKILKILEKYSDGIIIKSELDDTGARVLYN